MNQNLYSYIKIYNILDLDKCRETIVELENCQFKKHEFYHHVRNQYISFDKELDIYYGTPNHNDYFMKQIWEGLHQYLTELEFTWFGAWTGYSQIRYNKYSPGTQMKKHCDHIRTLFPGANSGVPILSIVGCLNDNFKGGKFLMFDNDIINLSAGDLMIFPSNFLYPHEVTEVTNGTRYSFVSWAY